MPATKQLRLPFPERQLLLPLDDLVDVVDLNADEFIVVHGTNCVTFVRGPNDSTADMLELWSMWPDYHDAEIDF